MQNYQENLIAHNKLIQWTVKSSTIFASAPLCLPVTMALNARRIRFTKGIKNENKISNLKLFSRTFQSSQIEISDLCVLVGI